MIADLQERAEAGKAKYGTYLETFNGRDALWDAYQESLDLPMYLRQLIEERDTNLVLVGHGQDPRSDVPIDLGEVRTGGRTCDAYLYPTLRALGYSDEELGYFGRKAESVDSVALCRQVTQDVADGKLSLPEARALLGVDDDVCDLDPDCEGWGGTCCGEWERTDLDRLAWESPAT